MSKASTSQPVPPSAGEQLIGGLQMSASIQKPSAALTVENKENPGVDGPPSRKLGSVSIASKGSRGVLSRRDNTPDVRPAGFPSKARLLPSASKPAPAAPPGRCPVSNFSGRFPLAAHLIFRVLSKFSFNRSNMHECNYALAMVPEPIRPHTACISTADRRHETLGTGHSAIHLYAGTFKYSR